MWMLIKLGCIGIILAWWIGAVVAFFNAFSH